MDHAGGLGRLGAVDNGPGPYLLGAGGKIGDQPQELIAVADQAVQSRLFQTHVVEEGLFLLSVQLRYLGFELAADHYRPGAFRHGDLPYLDHEGVLAVQVVLSHVCHVKDRFISQKVQVAQPKPLILVFHHAAKLPDLFQEPLDPLIEGDLVLCLFVPAARHFFGALDLLVHRVQIGQGQFGIDHFDVV